MAPPARPRFRFEDLRDWLRDPSYSPSVRTLPYPTVWFNAWKYAREQDLWQRDRLGPGGVCEYAGPGGREAARDDESRALRATLPARCEQQRQDQEPDCREQVRDEAE